MPSPPESTWRVFTRRHPLLGEFRIKVDFAGLATARFNLAEQRLELVAEPGVVIETPPLFPDVTVLGVTLDFRAKALTISSEPALGALEQHLLSGLLGDTLLRDLGGDGLKPLGVDGLERTSRGLRVFKGRLVDVFAHPEASLTMEMSATRLTLRFSEPIELDFGLFGVTPLTALAWVFKSGRLEPELRGTPDLWDQIVKLILPLLVRTYFKGKVPEAMLRVGYDPMRDGELEAHLNALILGFSGAAPRPQAAPESDERALAPAEPATGDAPRRSGVRVAINVDDAIEVRVAGGVIDVSSRDGLFFHLPRHPWLDDVRLTRLRYELTTDTLTVDGTHAVGEAVAAQLAEVVKARVIDPVATWFATFDRDEGRRARLPFGNRHLLIQADGLVAATLDGRRATLSFKPSARLDGPWIIGFAIRRVVYDFGAREASVELRGVNCVARLFSGRARRAVVAGLEDALRALLPEPMRRPGYNLVADPDQSANLRALFSRRRDKDPELSQRAERLDEGIEAPGP